MFLRGFSVSLIMLLWGLSSVLWAAQKDVDLYTYKLLKAEQDFQKKLEEVSQGSGGQVPQENLEKIKSDYEKSRSQAGEEYKKAIDQQMRNYLKKYNASVESSDESKSQSTLVARPKTGDENSSDFFEKAQKRKNRTQQQEDVAPLARQVNGVESVNFGKSGAIPSTAVTPTAPSH